jgi:hypothetical protein
MLTLPVQVIPLNPQLVLPLPELGVSSLLLTPEPPPIPPQHLWQSLSMSNQLQVRQTILRILQEMLHDNPHA